MASENNTSKLGNSFATRLRALAATEKVRVVVKLNTDAVQSNAARRQSSDVRQTTLDAVRRAAQAALPQIDEILARCGGQRLTNPNALGTVSVESTPHGIAALEASECVAAILEDQIVAPLPVRKSA
jgi:hypothetical protein